MGGSGPIEIQNYNSDDLTNNYLEVRVTPYTLNDTITKRREAVGCSIDNMHNKLEDLPMATIKVCLKPSTMLYLVITRNDNTCFEG